MRSGAEAETDRLLAAAARYGGVLLPPLSAGELYALGGDSQLMLDGDEASWWAGMTGPGRTAMKAVALDMLVTRELLESGSPGVAVAPGVALTLEARQDPAVMVACARPDGVTAWAPRLYGVGPSGGGPPRAMVLEIVMDRIHRLFGPLHEFGLMSTEAAVRFLTWWVQTPFRARHARKEPPRYVSVFRGSPSGEVMCDELGITLERHGMVGVTVEPHEGRTTSVTCEPAALARLFTRIIDRRYPPGGGTSAVR
jgi:hypothetical protein